MKNLTRNFSTDKDTGKCKYLFRVLVNDYESNILSDCQSESTFKFIDLSLVKEKNPLLPYTIHLWPIQKCRKYVVTCRNSLEEILLHPHYHLSFVTKARKGLNFKFPKATLQCWNDKTTHRFSTLDVSIQKLSFLAHIYS